MRYPLVIFSVSIVVACSILYANNIFTVVNVNDNLTKLGADIFLKYLFIIVAVERAAAVFVGISRNQSKVDWSLRINRINEILQKENPSVAVLKQIYAREHRLTTKLEQKNIIGKIEDVPNNPIDQDYLGFLTSTKHAYEFQRARFNSVSNNYVSRIVFFAGIILATVGISVFQDLLQDMNLVTAMEEEIKSGALVKTGLAWQSGLLRLADILVTGGLLGGGSTALNAIANRVTEFMNKS